MPNDAENVPVGTLPLSATYRDAAVKPEPKEAVRPTDASAPPDKIGTFHTLALRSFRLLWISILFGSAGMWIQMVTLGWLVYDLTGSGTLLGAMNGMRAIPMLLLAPLAGIAADRMNRKTLMMGGQIVLVVLALAIAIGLVFDRVTVWHLFVFTFIAGVVQVFYMPAQQTAVFDIVPRPLIPNAVALSGAAFNTTRVLGPGAAGLLIAWLGPEGNFFVQSCAYAGVIITLAMIAFPPRKAPQDGRKVGFNIGEAIHHVISDRPTRTLMMLAYIPPILLIPSFMALMPIFAKDVFHVGPEGLGILMSASGLGGLLGALFTASLGRLERRGLLALVMLMVASAGLLAFALAPSMYVALPLLLVAGFCEMVYMTTNQTMLQLSVPDHMRGRITSLMMLTFAVMPIASFIFGSAADLVGAQTVVKVASAIALALGLLILVFVPWVRNLRLSDLGPVSLGQRSP